MLENDIVCADLTEVDNELGLTDLRRERDDLSDDSENTESSQQWRGDVESRALMESDESMDVEEPVTGIIVSVMGHDIYWHVRYAVAQVGRDAQG